MDKVINKNIKLYEQNKLSEEGKNFLIGLLIEKYKETGLKTLKDLEKNSIFDYPIVELRQEAIKWIKELIDDKPTNVSLMRMVGKNRLQQLEFTIVWIKHFFNITDGDLND